jgi:hypothetical protein
LRRALPWGLRRRYPRGVKSSPHAPSLRGLAVLVALSCSGPASAVQESAPAGLLARPIDPAITAADIEATVRYLASDDLRGRSTGSLELMAAAEGLSARLAAAGVAPGGEGQGYLQHVPLARIEYAAVPTLAFELQDGSLREAVWGVDFDSVSGVLEPASFELAVIGPDGAPSAPAKAGRALYVDARGRAAREIVAGPGDGFGLIVMRGSERPGRGPDTTPPKARRDPGGAPTVIVRGSLLEALAAGGVHRVHAGFPGRLVEPPAANVIGVIEGAGTPERPELADQCVVFSAHYDHIGVDAAAKEGEDAVYNGADDDASGCAAVLELAEAFAAGPRPARTLVFLFATGEEIGLIGTNHYLAHPLVPLERTVCNLNFEMIGRPDALAGGPGKLWLTGFERSNLGPAFAGAGLALVADPRPEQNFFQRSDNYAFALRGIVAQTLSSYDLHTDYHQVSDEAGTLDYGHMQAAVNAAWTGARALADGTIDPAWAPGGAPTR